MDTKQITVSAVNLFPVRSCAGEALQQAEITPNGLKFDRQFRLIGADKEFLTQRECPKMALIRPQVKEGVLHLNYGENVAPGGHDNPARAAVTISDSSSGIDQGDQVAAWLTAVLGVEARLLRVVGADNSADNTDFARPDMSPILVISQESLADLNSRLEKPVLINRFRPNIVVRGGQPYEEESWTRVLIGSVTYVASSEPCGRCSLINIDQEKGERAGKEPLKTLASYRRFDKAVIFGKYMVPQSSGTVAVGDNVSVILEQ